MEYTTLLDSPILLFMIGVISALGLIAVIYWCAINFPETREAYIDLMCKTSTN